MKVNKKIQGIFALLTTVLIALLLIGCPEEPGPKGPVEHTISVSSRANTNGSVVPSKTRAFEGDEITLTVTPANEYRLQANSLRWSGGVSNNNVINNDKFTMPNASVTIDAIWLREDTNYEYSITSIAAGISASPRGGNGGETITVTVTPPQPYLSLVADSIKINGEPINGLTFTMPTENVILDGLFTYENWRTDLNTATLFGPPKYVFLDDIPDEPINAFLATMDLQQKAGQMSLPTHPGSASTANTTNNFLGAILNGGGGRPTVSELNDIYAASSSTGVNIPLLFGIDSVHGANNWDDTVVFPHNSAMAAIAVADLKTGMELQYKRDTISAIETTRKGVYWTFNPCVTVPQDVRWGRTYEGMSENYEVGLALAVSSVRGVQDNGMAATAKHFFGEGMARYGGNATAARITATDAEMQADANHYRELYNLTSVYTMMPTLGQINLGGRNPEPNLLALHRHDLLMNTFIKGDPSQQGIPDMGNNIGFKGFIVGDWGGQAASWTNTVNAGVDMPMPGGTTASTYRSNNAAGGISDTRRDDAVRRILRVKTSLGLMKIEGNTLVPVPYPTIASNNPVGNSVPEHITAAREIASKTFVLMKNENRTIQQLRAAQNILFLGQAADSLGIQIGGWAYSGHQGSTTSRNLGQSVWQAAQARMAEMGKTITLSNNAEASAANAINGTYDAIVVFIADSPHGESNEWFNEDGWQIQFRVGGGGVNSLRGNFNDQGLLNTVWNYRQDNPDVPVVYVLFAGRPMGIKNPNTIGNNPGQDVDNWDAFVWAGLPGSEGGNAMLDVLFASGGHDGVFFGKSPYTWRSDYRKSQWQNELYAENSVVFPYGHGINVPLE